MIYCYALKTRSTLTFYRTRLLKLWKPLASKYNKKKFKRRAPGPSWDSGLARGASYPSSLSSKMTHGTFGNCTKFAHRQIRFVCCWGSRLRTSPHSSTFFKEVRALTRHTPSRWRPKNPSKRSRRHSHRARPTESTPTCHFNLLFWVSFPNSIP